MKGEKALRSAHHTDPDVLDEGFGGGGGLAARRLGSLSRVFRWSCVRSRKCPQKHLVNSSSVYLFLLPGLRPSTTPPPLAEIHLIPPRAGTLAHRFCVSGSLRTRGEWGLCLAQGHVSNVELGRRFVVLSTLPNLLRL